MTAPRMFPWANIDHRKDELLWPWRWSCALCGKRGAVATVRGLAMSLSGHPNSRRHRAAVVVG